MQKNEKKSHRLDWRWQNKTLDTFQTIFFDLEHSAR